MKLTLIGDDFARDVLSSPDTAALASQRYSEWYHFTFGDVRAGIGGVVNFALFGDVRDPERGRASMSLVVHEGARRWSGTVDMYGTDEARFTPGTVGLAMGSNTVRFDEGRYAVAAELKNRTVSIDATWTPRADAVRVENIGGFVNSFIVPRLDVTGVVRIGDRAIALERAGGYHDHNWGAWDWDRDVGWNWGYLLEAGAPRERENAVVFGQVTDATRGAARSGLVVMRWRGAKLTQVFLDDAVTLEALGRLAVEPPRVPGVLALFVPGRVAPVPEHLRVVAADGADTLRIDCRVRDAIHFLIPHAAGNGQTTVAELAGDYAASGELDGESVAFTCPAFAELAGTSRSGHPASSDVDV